MHCPSEDYHLPVNSCLSHLVLKGEHSFLRHKGIFCAMEDQYLCLYIFCIFRIRYCKCAMEAHYPCNIGAAARQFKHSCAAKAMYPSSASSLARFFTYGPSPVHSWTTITPGRFPLIASS